MNDERYSKIVSLFEKIENISYFNNKSFVLFNYGTLVVVPTEGCAEMMDASEYKLSSDAFQHFDDYEYQNHKNKFFFDSMMNADEFTQEEKRCIRIAYKMLHNNDRSTTGMLIYMDDIIGCEVGTGIYSVAFKDDVHNHEDGVEKMLRILNRCDYLNPMVYRCVVVQKEENVAV